MAATWKHPSQGWRCLLNYPGLFEWKVQDGISAAFKERAGEPQRCLSEDVFFSRARSERWAWLVVSDDLLSSQSKLIAAISPFLPPSRTPPPPFFLFSFCIWNTKYHVFSFSSVCVSAKWKRERWNKKGTSPLWHQIWTVAPPLKDAALKTAGPVFPCLMDRVKLSSDWCFSPRSHSSGYRANFSWCPPNPRWLY